MTKRAIAAAAYRKDVAAAIATYHEAIGETWRNYGRNPVCELTRAILSSHWENMKYDLRIASAKLDRVPVGV